MYRTARAATRRAQSRLGDDQTRTPGCPVPPEFPLPPGRAPGPIDYLAAAEYTAAYLVGAIRLGLAVGPVAF